jgi:hypothetical protein
VKATAANGYTWRERMDTRRSCWAITVVAWALRSLCPDAHRRDIASWAVEFSKLEAAAAPEPRRLSVSDRRRRRGAEALIFAAVVVIAAEVLALTVRYSECRAHGFSAFYCVTSR